MIVFDELQKTKEKKKTVGYFFSYIVTKSMNYILILDLSSFIQVIQLGCFWVFFFTHILSLIRFIFVACVSGCNKFFEPCTAGSMFLVKAL